MIPALCKWPGSKRSQALDLAARLLPDLQIGETYCEIFAGSLAVLFALRGAGWTGPAVVAEAHPAHRHLLSLLASPKTAIPGEIYAQIQALEASYRRGGLSDDGATSAYERKAIYLAERRAHNAREGGEAERAARWLWLLARCFNGLARSNRAGEHNAPHGDGTGALPTMETLRQCAAWLRGVTVYDDWTRALAETADLPRVIYADPPYVGTFAGYSRAGWTAEDRARLSGALRGAAARGASVLISEGEGAQGAYPWAESEEVPITYSVGGGHRGRETREVILWSSTRQGLSRSPATIPA